MGSIGYFFLGIGLLAALINLLFLVSGCFSHKRFWVIGVKQLSYLTMISIGISCLALLAILVKGDYGVVYAFTYTSDHLPLIYKICAFWAGDAGSLLFWTGLLALVLGIYIYSERKKKDSSSLPVIGVVILNIALFMLILLAKSNPFALMETQAQQGVGLNPMLRNPYMISHPLTLFIGYALLVVPFGLAVSYLIFPTKRTWTEKARNWVLASWIFLTLGNLLGAMWAYQELGWGGYWAWDPVENASFIPWLLVTALLHTMHLERKFSMCRLWNLLLICSAYLLTIFGTFIVRSGVLQSVHAFSNTGTGIYFLSYIFIVIVGFVYLVYRAKSVSEEVKNRDTVGINMLIGGALILSLTGFIVWAATIYPLFTSFITGETMNLTGEFYNTATAPLFASLILLMGAWPIIGYGNSLRINKIKWIILLLLISMGIGAFLYYSTGGPFTAVLGYTICALASISLVKETAILIYKKIREGNIKPVNLFQRIPVAAHLIHLGVVILALGVITTQVYSQHHTKTLHKGETFEVSGYYITYEGLGKEAGVDRTTIYAILPVSIGEKVIYELNPRRSFYENWNPIARVAISGTWARDIYVQLAGWDDFGNQATFMIHINPLIRTIWLGGFLLALGGFIAFFRRV